MDNGLYLLKIAIASAAIGALIKWIGPTITLPESVALLMVLLPTAIVGGTLLRRLSQG